VTGIRHWLLDCDWH